MVLLDLLKVITDGTMITVFDSDFNVVAEGHCSWVGYNIKSRYMHRPVKYVYMCETHKSLMISLE